jgi:hypothetical protein
MVNCRAYVFWQSIAYVRGTLHGCIMKDKVDGTVAHVGKLRITLG